MGTRYPNSRISLSILFLVPIIYNMIIVLRYLFRERQLPLTLISATMQVLLTGLHSETGISEDRFGLMKNTPNNRL